MNKIRGHDIIVIGASLGGIEALPLLISQLPKDLPAAVFIVMHLSAGTGIFLLDRLKPVITLKAHLAVNNEPIRHGNVYIARSGLQMLLKQDLVVLERGPKENRFRPAIDPLFRSAALSCTSRVIGIILSGMLDDGSAGLWAVKRCGGVTIAQDPADATSPDMPKSAISHVKPDFVLRVADMGGVVTRLVYERAPKAPPLPKDIAAEERLMETTNLSLVEKKELIGKNSPFSCPECNGPLYEKKIDDLRTFQCNIGHRFTARTLATTGRSKAEGTLWTALEGLEENAEILTILAEDEQNQGNTLSANELRRNARESLRRADLLRQMLTENNRKREF